MKVVVAHPTEILRFLCYGTVGKVFAFYKEVLFPLMFTGLLGHDKIMKTSGSSVSLRNPSSCTSGSL